MKGDVTVFIRELHFDGVPASGRFDVANGLRVELARLIADRGVPPGLTAGQPPVVQPLRSGLLPHELGASLARALYEGWS